MRNRRAGEPVPRPPARAAAPCSRRDRCRREDAVRLVVAHLRYASIPRAPYSGRDHTDCRSARKPLPGLATCRSAAGCVTERCSRRGKAPASAAARSRFPPGGRLRPPHRRFRLRRSAPGGPPVKFAGSSERSGHAGPRKQRCCPENDVPQLRNHDASRFVSGAADGGRGVPRPRFQPGEARQGGAPARPGFGQALRDGARQEAGAGEQPGMLLVAAVERLEQQVEGALHHRLARRRADQLDARRLPAPLPGQEAGAGQGGDRRARPGADRHAPAAFRRQPAEPQQHLPRLRREAAPRDAFGGRAVTLREEALAVLLREGVGRQLRLHGLPCRQRQARRDAGRLHRHHARRDRALAGGQQPRLAQRQQEQQRRRRGIRRLADLGEQRLDARRRRQGGDLAQPGQRRPQQAELDGEAGRSALRGVQDRPRRRRCTASASAWPRLVAPQQGHAREAACAAASPGVGGAAAAKASRAAASRRIARRHGGGAQQRGAFGRRPRGRRGGQAGRCSAVSPTASSSDHLPCQIAKADPPPDAARRGRAPAPCPARPQQRARPRASA